MLSIQLDKVIIREKAFVNVIGDPLEIVVERNAIFFCPLKHFFPVFLVKPREHERWLVHDDGKYDKLEKLLLPFILYPSFVRHISN